MSAINKGLLGCDFCLKPQTDVEKLIASGGLPGSSAIHICNECIKLAQQILDGEGGSQTRYDELVSRMVDIAGLEAIKPPEPLVEGWLYKDTLAWIGGKPGHCKSFVAVELACCVGTGTPWHWNPVAKGKVLYLIAEGVAGLAQRFRAWADEQTTKVTDVIFLPLPLRLADPASTDVLAFARVLAEYKPDLVIIDTQARVTVGADENSSKDMGQFVEALGKLREQISATVLVVHHEPRNAENLRGSIALEGAADTILRVYKDGTQVTVSNPKQKDAAAQDEFQLILTPKGESAILEQEGPGAAKSDNGNEQRILDTLLHWPGYEAPSGELLEVSGVPKTSYYRSLASLAARSKIVLRNSGNGKYYSIPEHARPAPKGV
jgi:hypothetical protein